MIEKLLNEDPLKRPNIEEILTDPWMTDESADPNEIRAEFYARFTSIEEKRKRKQFERSQRLKAK